MESVLVKWMLAVATLFGLALLLGRELMQRLADFLESADRLRNRNREDRDGDDQ